MWTLLIVAVMLSPRGLSSAGVSRRKADDQLDAFNVRHADFVENERVACEIPAISQRLPTRIRTKIETIWKNVEPKSSDCWIEMARTRNVMLSMTKAERAAMLNQTIGRRICAIPSIVSALPPNLQRKIANIWRRNSRRVGNGRPTSCWEKQRKTRLLLLNLPLTQNSFNPPAFDCALPHFFERLETPLQDQLKAVWKNYKKGSPCVEQIDRQIQILEANEISLKSFQMPPPVMFRRREILRKLRKKTNVA